ncbi:hypothetical protein BHM03_00041465, partial [Ensete ventricosum]
GRSAYRSAGGPVHTARFGALPLGKERGIASPRSFRAASPHLVRSAWRRLTSFVLRGVASRRETSDLTVPPNSGWSAYRYPVRPVCTAHSGRNLYINSNFAISLGTVWYKRYLLLTGTQTRINWL